MTTRVLEVRATMNESGRVVLPKQLREALGAKPGDALIFSSDGETFRIETQRQTQPYGLSLGDRACLALAITTGSPVYTADRAWGELAVGVEVRLVR